MNLNLFPESGFCKTYPKNMASILFNSSGANYATRIAHFIWTFGGNNRIDMLQYYTDAYDDKTDDDIHLRGAYGPRLRNWIGADQLEEANRKNVGITEPSDYQKPVGIDQLRSAYEDLVDLESGLTTTVLGVFDPAIDFEVSNDIPNLMSVCMTIDTDKCLNMNLNYSVVEYDIKTINDIWTFNMLARIYAAWLKCTSHRVTVFGAKFPLNGLEVQVSTCAIVMFADNPDMFLADFQLLERFEMHMRKMLTTESNENPDIAVVQLKEMLVETLIDNMKMRFTQDLAYALLIYALVKLDALEYEEYIIELYNEITSPIKQEVASYLSRYVNYSQTQNDKFCADAEV